MKLSARIALLSMAVTTTFGTMMAGNLGIVFPGKTSMFTLIPTNLSLFLSNNGIGSVASVGYLTAFALVGVFIGGLAVTRLSNFLKKCSYR